MGRFLDFAGVDAVLFDCDGVVVDSEPVSEWAWRTTLADLAVELGPFSGWVGTTDEAIARRFSAQAHIGADDLEGMAQRRLLDRLAEEPLAVYEDALTALDRAEAARLGLALVTNSSRPRLEAILASAGLTGRFPVTVTSDDVSNPKPAPDVYLLAAELLSSPPSRCLVVEDSPTGIASARAAGMRVVAVDRGLFERRRLETATRVLSSLLS